MKRDQNVIVLDHGFVRQTDAWGREELDSEAGEEAIIAAARMSTGKGFQRWGEEEACATCSGSGTNEPENGPGSLCKVCRGRKVAINIPGDEKLLAFLYGNRHMTPFEMAGATFEVQAPIMVFREWHRHRTQSYNEMSARYTPLPDLHYVPTVERMLINSKTNKQAGTVKDADELTEAAAQDLRMEEMTLNRAAETFYQKKLKAGVPKELARTHLGVSRYSRMRASANLRNWLLFATLRNDPAAQWEIRQFAIVLQQKLTVFFPKTIELFELRRNK